MIGLLKYKKQKGIVTAALSSTISPSPPVPELPPAVDGAALLEDTVSARFEDATYSPSEDVPEPGSAPVLVLEPGSPRTTLGVELTRDDAVLIPPTDPPTPSGDTPLGAAESELDVTPECPPPSNISPPPLPARRPLLGNRLSGLLGSVVEFGGQSRGGWDEDIERSS
jgi:hypothetical protein